ncbi:hypothetical protein B0J18DRAFT_416795 [Chaetomium sp. MPI-SDFR-AT-0129]|nr:hypothetical protein B0J18DRAFT_416795 [Chaetomium sp. MPI-SDFR-AT-0129]
MRLTSIITTSTTVLTLALANPLTSPQPSLINAPCGQTLGDCADPLTCIPLSINCTRWVSSLNEGCPGTCQQLDLTQQKIYTLCGGWEFRDDCDERVEVCVADPRHVDQCGPSCDGMGICWPWAESCDEGLGLECPAGRVCFKERGICLPLRFGSDYYEKTRLEEEYRTDQDGWQGDDES